MADGTTSETRALLISIRPRYVESILSGSKTVELRRTEPRILPGTTIIIYASSPTMAVVATATAGHVIGATPEEIWRGFSAVAGVDRSAFDSYFSGSVVGFVLQLSAVKRLPKPIKLEALRRMPLGFCPPQSFRYLTESFVSTILQTDR